MIQNLYLAFEAVFPFFVYLSVGALLGRAGLINDTIGRAMNRIAFYACFPLLIFNSLASAELGDIRFGFLGTAAAILLLVALASFLLVPRFVKEDPKRGVMIQAFFRANIVLYMVPLASDIFGHGAEVEAAVLLSFFTMIQNVLGVLAFELYRGGRVSTAEIGKEMLKNPLILATLAGAVFLFFGWRVPALFQKPINALSSMGTPSIMLALGASLEPKEFRKNLPLLASTVVIRMLLLPLAIFLFGAGTGLTKAELFILIVLFASPVANNIYAMSLTMDGDTELAGQLVVISTVLSLATVFLWIYVCRTAGVIV